jgi:hypothetical protein
MLIPDAVSAEFFHTAAATAFVDLLINGNRETWPIRSKRFRTWLRRRHYEATRTAANAAAVNSALDLFEAQAQFEGPERAVHVRLAEHAGHIYLDLADECWRAVDIGPDGWRVIGSSPVRFRRTAGMLPLPLPQGGGSIEELASFLNLPSRNDFVLVVAWTLATLRAGGPYPVLAISGEQGSAKTVLSKLLKALVDPNVAPVRALAREERDLLIAANNSHVLAFDNLSSLPHALSDAFCRSPRARASGCASSTPTQTRCCFKQRARFFSNGIEDVINRPDLADRTLSLTLPAIADHRRRSERQLSRDFEVARSRILGSLLEAAAHGLRNLPGIYLERLPRMADFALWATACETASWPAGTFARAYEANRRTAIEDLIDADPVAARVRQIIANRSTWTGSASDLLRMGAELAHHSISRGGQGWPKNPRELAGRLRRAQTFLHTLGMEMIFGRAGRVGTRTITIRTGRENTVSTVSSVGDNDHDPGSRQPSPWPLGAVRDKSHRPETAPTAADDAGNADAKAGFHFG